MKKLKPFIEYKNSKNLNWEGGFHDHDDPVHPG